jgi:hypothetical protein
VPSLKSPIDSPGTISVFFMDAAIEENVIFVISKRTDTLPTTAIFILNVFKEVLGNFKSQGE